MSFIRRAANQPRKRCCAISGMAAVQASSCPPFIRHHIFWQPPEFLEDTTRAAEVLSRFDSSKLPNNRMFGFCVQIFLESSLASRLSGKLPSAVVCKHQGSCLKREQDRFGCLFVFGRGCHVLPGNFPLSLVHLVAGLAGPAKRVVGLIEIFGLNFKTS